ncbi:MAG: hypothetical protein AABY83_09010 [Pseudomonadota bacterium]
MFWGLAGCATLFNPQPQKVYISAQDDGRTVPVIAEIDGREHYTVRLPMDVPLTPASRGDTTVTINDPCYDAVKQVLEEHTNAISLLNFANYFVGALIDYNSGAMWMFENPVVIPVRRRSPAPCASESANSAKPARVLSLPPPRVRHHRLHGGFASASGYGNGKDFARGSSAGGFAAGYEYMLSDTLGVQLRSSGMGNYTGGDYTQGHMQTSLSTQTLTLRHYFPRIRGMYVGVGLGNNTVSTAYSRAYPKSNPAWFEPPYTYNDATVSSSQSYLAIDVGWRTHGAVFIGVDVQLAAPALTLARDRNPQQAHDADTITDLQDRKKVVDINESLLKASQFNFYLGLAF